MMRFISFYRLQCRKPTYDERICRIMQYLCKLIYNANILHLSTYEDIPMTKFPDPTNLKDISRSAFINIGSETLMYSISHN